MKNRSLHAVLTLLSITVLFVAFTGKNLIPYHAIIGWSGFIVITTMNILLLNWLPIKQNN